MSLNYPANNSNDHLDGNQSESPPTDSERSNRKPAAKNVKKAKTTRSDALDPDIIPPAANRQEEDIDSEFYPEIYIH